MVTNTVVIKLTPNTINNESNSAGNLQACGDVAFFRLQTEINNFEELINNGDVKIVSLTKSFQKVLLVCKETLISTRIFDCLSKENALYKVYYSRQDTTVSESKDEQSYLKIPKDFESKFLISPPHTPRYKNFKYMVIEEDPIELNTLNKKILQESEIAKGDSKTRILLKNSSSGVKITLTDCCDQLASSGSNLRVHKTQFPPKSIFDDM